MTLEITLPALVMPASWGDLLVVSLPSRWEELPALVS